MKPGGGDHRTSQILCSKNVLQEHLEYSPILLQKKKKNPWHHRSKKQLIGSLHSIYTPLHASSWLIKKMGQVAVILSMEMCPSKDEILHLIVEFILREK